ncbi:hypothetical protein QBC47DRAFT_436474 [Echria macrotheca]|uniref:Zn(2)-C6 fungal-type domain-containing protein n=1 Tax=Echria macrotheca TaxID=438768 RepID=A0AAJ0BKY3_9PEZI|nr:hypothetical protein QBC47DRAFT_436474 [Echria macrotheca]
MASALNTQSSTGELLPMEVETTALSTLASAPTTGPTSAPSSAAASASASSPSTPTEPRRRNRPALSCIQCRTRKIRCDRMEPCASCIKSKIVNCTYEEARRPKPRLWRLSPTADGDSPTSDTTYPRYATSATSATFSFRPDAPASTAAGIQYANSAAAASLSGMKQPELAPISSPSYAESTGGGHTPSGNNTAALEDRVRQLEQQLADALKRQGSVPRGVDPSQSIHGLSISNHGSAHMVTYAKEDRRTNKPKFFPLITAIAEQVERDRNSQTAYLLRRCKGTAKGIKLQVRKALDRSNFDIGSTLLPEKTTLQLVESYFRTFESVYRILHRPTFWREYHRYWENPSAVSDAFVIQFKLCMVVGACFHDDLPVHRQSLATKWVYEAQVWLAFPDETSRISIEGLQIMCLLHLARETCGIGGDHSWITAGSLLRLAMHLGLHRDPDPSPNLSILRVEMRRRLWATVLEIVLQSSLDCGGPPLVALSDFDTRPPSNYDDDQLVDSEQVTPAPRPLSTFTQTTVQLALLRSYSTRLAIAEYVSHFSAAASYEETLKWNTELTNACRALSAMLQPSYDPAGILPKRLSLFQLRLAEHMVHRFFLALNHPWLAQNNPAYYFARKMCVETSFKLYRAIATASPASDSGTASQRDDFTRLATCGYGSFRSVPTLAVLSICLELLWQVQEDQSFRQSMDIDPPLDRSGPPSDSDAGSTAGIGSGAAPRQDLVDAVKYAILWTNHRIMAGETNIKGRLFYSALLTQVQALQRGAPEMEVERQVIANLDLDLDHCWRLLKDVEATTPGSPVVVDEWDTDDYNPSRRLWSIFNSNDIESFLR